MKFEDVEEFREEELCSLPESGLLLNGKKIDSTNPLLVYVVVSADKEKMGVYLTESAAKSHANEMNDLAKRDDKPGKRMIVLEVYLHE